MSTHISFFFFSYRLKIVTFDGQLHFEQVNLAYLGDQDLSAKAPNYGLKQSYP